MTNLITLVHVINNLPVIEGQIIREKGIESIVGETDPILKTVIGITFKNKDEIKYVIRSKGETILDQSTVTKVMFMKNVTGYFREQNTLRAREFGVEKYKLKMQEYNKGYIAGSREFRQLVLQELYEGVLQYTGEDFSFEFDKDKVKLRVANRKLFFRYTGNYTQVQVIKGNGELYKTVDYRQLNETVLELITKGKVNQKTILKDISAGLKENNIQVREINSTTLEVQKANLVADGNFLRVQWKKGGGVRLTSNLYNYKGCIKELVNMLGTVSTS